MRSTLTSLIARRPVAALAVGGALALALTSCGGTNDSSTPSPASASSPAGSSNVQGIGAAHNDADVTFINDMAPHHSGAIAMAQLAAGQAGSAKVKDLAHRISAAQGPEIVTMTAMAGAWKVALSTDAGAMSGMGGMSNSGHDVDALTALTGPAFDKEFLTRMTAHHATAVQMAQTEIAQGINTQAKELAASIVAAQQKEIAEMAGLRTGA